MSQDKGITGAMVRALRSIWVVSAGLVKPLQRSTSREGEETETGQGELQAGKFEEETEGELAVLSSVSRDSLSVK